MPHKELNERKEFVQERERSIKGTHTAITHIRDIERERARKRKFEKITGSDTRCKYKNIIGTK